MIERLNNLQSKIQSTTKLLKLGELKIKLSQLSDEMSRPDFWSNPENAQNISQDYQDIKSEVEKWGE